MANHAKVINPKSPITPDIVCSVMARVNQEQLKGRLQIQYTICEGDPHAWGPHVWEFDYIGGDGENYGGRVCWLNEDGTFEMRHGGGSNFVWWMDGEITKAIARECGGNFVDDAFGDDEHLPLGPEQYVPGRPGIDPTPPEFL